MIEFGKRVEGKLQLMPQKMLTETVPGAIYELHIKTQGVPNPEECARHLSKELPKRVHGLRLIWIGFDGDVIKMQIVGSPFSWALLLFLLPTILALIGIVMVFISIWGVITAIPTWAIALLIIGLGVILFRRPIAEALAPIPIRVERR